jgi:hypothetical protein
VKWWVTLALCLCACAPHFVEEWQVNEPRLTGARVEVDGDPTRPRPKLGEAFSLRYQISLPSGTWPTPLADRYAFALALCLGFQASSGVLVCLGEQQLTPTVTPVNDNQVLLAGLKLDLSGLNALGITPDELASGAGELAQIDRLTLFGVFCVDGTPERLPGTVAGKTDPSQLYRCMPRADATFTDATPFTLSVFLDRGLPEDANRDPAFACDPAAPDSPCNAGTMLKNEPIVPGEFVIAKPAPTEGTGMREVLPWPARKPEQPLPWDNCAADSTLIQIRAKTGEHTLRARFDPSDREPYSYVIPYNGQPQTRMGREYLTLTHEITLQAGKLNRFTSKLDSGDPDAQGEISFRWTPPEKGSDVSSIPDTGRLVRFYFTLRDERGGVDFSTRELCLLPALRGD